MQDIDKPSIVRRVLKFSVGTEEPWFIAAAASVSAALGYAIVLHAMYFGARPIAPSQAVTDGLLLGAIFLPFVFLAVARASFVMSAWDALAMLAAAAPCPLIGSRLVEAGAGRFPVMLGCIAFVGAVFLLARSVRKRLA